MKTSKSYYFCQFLGSLLFFSIIFALDLSAKKDHVVTSYDIIAFIKTFIFSILATHFILRAYIKKHLSNTKSSLKIYAIAILLSAVITAVVTMVWGLAFGDSEKNYLSFSYIASNTVISLFIYSLWSAIYLAITSIRERIKLRQQLKDQELASLMNQINPHFLFNSLNTIRGMIFEDKDKSAELVTKLSTLFRYNLSTDTKAHTSLAAELEVCQHYLAIEDIRLGERLKVNINVSPESEKAKIPTMGLLTLVENAIKHGISHLKQGGTLTLTSSIENNNVLIKVSNPYQADLVKSGTQVGLKNLQQRIDLIFAHQGKLSQTCDNGTFTVNLTLPYEAV